MWGPGGRLNWEFSPKSTGSRARSRAGLCRGQRGSQLRRTDAVWLPCGRGSRAAAALGCWVLAKAPKRRWSPPGWLLRARREQQTREAISPVLGEHELPEQGAESPRHPWRARIPAHTGLSHAGVKDLIFFLFFSRAAMTCHVKAFY